MSVTAGVDVGSAAVKAVVMRVGGGEHEVLGRAVSRMRRRNVAEVVTEAFEAAVAAAGVGQLDYVATTGEGEDAPFATGHFYGMTTHARGALFLEPRARAVLDVGALHARAVAMDPRGKVLGYKMTSQCASGSGQFLENIARYLGVSQADIGALSLSADRPEAVSSICAVLAETDVINMVSRGLSAANILRGIHESMAGRYARLIQSLGTEGVVFVSGGLASDDGLAAALERALQPEAACRGKAFEVARHPLSAFAGAIGAAIWGGFRREKLAMGGAAWTANAMTSSSGA
ncbi:MAG: benzoyl-CoA reductase subunit D [Thermoanaerobaculia bacterium]